MSAWRHSGVQAELPHTESATHPHEMWPVSHRQRWIGGSPITLTEPGLDLHGRLRVPTGKLESREARQCSLRNSQGAVEWGICGGGVGAMGVIEGEGPGARRGQRPWGVLPRTAVRRLCLHAGEIQV